MFEAVEESLFSRYSRPPRALPFPLVSFDWFCRGGVVLPGDELPDVVAEGLPKSLSRTSSYLRCFSSRFFSAMACRSSGVGSGGLFDSSSESQSSPSSPNCPTPVVAPSTPVAEEDGRVAICGLRLSSVTVGLMSCFSGTSERASMKWNVCGASLRGYQVS